MNSVSSQLRYQWELTGSANTGKMILSLSKTVVLNWGPSVLHPNPRSNWQCLQTLLSKLGGCY